jgi:hypothetical protein
MQRTRPSGSISQPAFSAIGVRACFEAGRAWRTIQFQTVARGHGLPDRGEPPPGRGTDRGAEGSPARPMGHLPRHAGRLPRHFSEVGDCRPRSTTRESLSVTHQERSRHAMEPSKLAADRSRHTTERRRVKPDLPRAARREPCAPRAGGGVPRPEARPAGRRPRIAWEEYKPCRGGAESSAKAARRVSHSEATPPGPSR